MNPLVALCAVLVSITLLAGVVGSLIAVISGLLDDVQHWSRVGVGVIGLIVSLTLSVCVCAAAFPDDEATHCAPGTHYVELHDGKYSTWECEADS